MEYFLPAQNFLPAQSDFVAIEKNDTATHSVVFLKSIVVGVQ
jgi:hypothetical protein